MCKWLGVSRSGYSDWEKRQPSTRAIEDNHLKALIKKIYHEHEERYGSPRIFKELKKQGYCIGKKRVERLMREMGLVARVTQVTRRAEGVRKYLAGGENLRPQGEVPSNKDEVWVADVTYLKVKGQWRYLSVVMDLYSRMILSWSLDKQRTAEVTKRTLENAIRKRQPEPGLIIHTDRGVEYRGNVYQMAIHRNGLKHSLNRAGHCTDNAHMESFFHSMKGELIRGRAFKNEAELRYAIGHYINRYYNTKRMHSGLNYRSPAEYEKRAA